ncbi:GNAT family N-acetyltransferase [Bernardetia sp.]|uniref:GNAT family N-acetyltransferase n=1 Tax=Bernardetia sp. TaxID=1937974 RepID=UPI0025C556C2|nr:GNAT family protein [Bernardetia sp.]
MNTEKNALENIQLESKNLILNSLSYKDIPKIIEYAGNRKVSDNLLNLPFPYHERDAVFWINMANEGRDIGDAYKFAIRLKADQALSFIGGIGLMIDKKHNKAELGYWIAEPFWGQGLVSEAVGAMIKFGFEVLELNKIFANHFISNPASGKVMIKNGMIKEAYIKDHYKKGDEYMDVIQYRLTKEEYQMRS